MTLQVIKLSPVADWDEVLIKANALGAQVAAALDCYGGSSDNKDCGVELISPSARQHLQKEKDKLRVTVWGSESFRAHPNIISYFL